MHPYRSLCIITLAVTSLMFSACKQELDFDETSLRPGQAEASFSSGNVNMDFPSSAGSASVDLDASGKWQAAFVNDRAKEWCRLSTDSGKRGKANITVSVTENPEYDQRSASIQFTCGDLSRTIVVTQKQKDAILVSSNRLDVKEEGGKVSIEVRANIAYEYNVSAGAESWIQPLDTRGLTPSTFYFQVSRNEELDKREGGIVFRSGTITETVKVYQDGATPTIIVSSSDVEVPPEGGPFSVEVRHNVSVSPVVSQECRWIKEVRTRSMSTSTFTFSAEKNNLRKDRLGRIVFKDDVTGTVDTLYVRQPLKTILLSSDTLFFSGRGSSAFFETDGSDQENYRLVPDGDWFSLTGLENVSGKGRCQVTAKPLEKPDQPRTGRIYVYLNGFSDPDTVRIRQYQLFPSFSYSTKAVETTPPDVEGDDLRGFVFWGDGTDEYYSPGLTHKYKESGLHTVLVELRDPRKVTLSGLENGMKVNFKEMGN